MNKKITLILLTIAIVIVGFAIGRSSGESGSFRVAERVKKVFPSLPPPPKDVISLEDGVGIDQSEIIIEIPSEGASIDGQFEVSGRFIDDGRGLTVVLKDSDGNILSETLADTESISDSDYGRFQAIIEEPVTSSTKLVIEIMSNLSDDTLIGPDAIRIVKRVPMDDFEVEIFFSNDWLYPFISCTRQYPVTRTVKTHDKPYTAAIESLLEGPTEEEVEEGYATSIPLSVSLLSLTIDEDGVATVDFSEELDNGVAGSCLVSAIRSQITTTLEQFSEIKEIVISVNGESEESLQP